VYYEAAQQKGEQLGGSRPAGGISPVTFPEHCPADPLIPFFGIVDLKPGEDRWRRQMSRKLQLFAQFIAAFNAGDVETLRVSYTEDALIIPPGQLPVQGPDAIITQSWGPMFEAFDLDADLRTDELQLGGGFGFVRGRYRMRLDPPSGGDSVAEEGRYIDIVRTDPNGAWKVARAIWTAK